MSKKNLCDFPPKPKMQPAECVKCGSETGPLCEVDAEHPGWLCPRCYRKVKAGISQGREPIDGTKLIAAERRRQIKKEGFDASHDDDHGEYTLSIAAACYAVSGSRVSVVNSKNGLDAWPWEDRFDKREEHDRKRRLVIAGALIAAEIDRIQREEDRT